MAEEQKKNDIDPYYNPDIDEEKPFPIAKAWVTSVLAGGVFLAMWGILTIVAIGLGIVSLRFPPESYWQHLCIEMCSGVTTFLLTPVVLIWAHKKPNIVRWLLGVLSIVCGVSGYYVEGAARLFFIEWTVMFAFLLGLELTLRKSFDALNAMFLETEGHG